MKELLKRYWWIIEYWLFWNWINPWSKGSSRRKINAICCKEKPYTPEQLRNYRW